MTDTERLALYVARVEKRMENLDHVICLAQQALTDARDDLSTLKAELGLSGGQPELLTESAPAGTGTESAERRGGPAGAA